MRYKRATCIFRHMIADAENYHDDQLRTEDLATRAWEKARAEHGPIARVFSDLGTFIRMMHAWASGQYRKIPWKSMAMIIGAVIYFVSPIDAIPDFIPFIGYLDDAFVIGLAMRTVRKDVEKFLEWENSPVMAASGVYEH